MIPLTRYQVPICWERQERSLFLPPSTAQILEHDFDFDRRELSRLAPASSRWAKLAELSKLVIVGIVGKVRTGYVAPGLLEDIRQRAFN